MSMIISRTPFRISFFGGGTDYPAWYRQNGGAVLSMAIDKYCYLTGRHFPPYFPGARYRIVWSHIEVVRSVHEILHPAIRVGLPIYGFDDDAEGLEIHHLGDLPARSGIGSSSSFAVGLIRLLKALRNEPVTKHELAMGAIDLEQNHLKDTVGSQDQVAAAYGGLNTIHFNRDGTIEVVPVRISVERRKALEDRLILFYTGTDRLSSQHAKAIIENIETKTDRLQKMHAMVLRAANVLEKGDLDEFGAMLDETWHLKRTLAQSVSNAAIDEIYTRAIAAGALGGKLLGAGGAGFMVFYVPEGAQEKVRNELRHLIQISVRIDDEGSIILHQGGMATTAHARMDDFVPQL